MRSAASVCAQLQADGCSVWRQPECCRGRCQTVSPSACICARVLTEGHNYPPGGRGGGGLLSSAGSTAWDQALDICKLQVQPESGPAFHAQALLGAIGMAERTARGVQFLPALIQAPGMPMCQGSEVRWTRLIHLLLLPPSCHCQNGSRHWLVQDRTPLACMCEALKACACMHPVSSLRDNLVQLPAVPSCCGILRSPDAELQGAHELTTMKAGV